MYGLNGPASTTDKIIYKRMKDLDMEIPKELQDVPVAKSRKGPAGQIVLRRMSGLANTSGKRIVDQFEQNIGGKEKLVEVLETVKDDLNKNQLYLLDLLKQGGKKTLSRLVAESGVEITGLMKQSAKGMVELGKVNAAIEAHRNLPALIKDLYTHALSGTDVCDACGGTTKLLPRPTAFKETRDCYFCKNTGKKPMSELKKFATEKILEVTKQIGDKGPLVSVQTGVQVNVGTTRGSIHEKIMGAADEVLYRREPTQVVEAEIVQPQSNPEQ